MNHLLTSLKFSFILFIGVFPLTSSADGGEDRIFKEWYESRNSGVSAVKLQQYNKLCGSCHFAYQPGLLPALSWEQIIFNFDNHFGVNLNLSPVDKRTMARYLLDNSAGHVNDDISNKILQSFNYEGIVNRITQTPYFVDKHSQFNSSVNSVSVGQCDGCHQNAMQGKYGLLSKP
ncbi:hypothetical protein [Solemya velum gill symbiont]|uniref:hypothetical protein n=1 Tax=Solemya velum gill symbiont TaxID=2340 RepID=UPI000997E7F0|nr:hypothetical protein [Solemya velum gill symbiont]